MQPQNLEKLRKRAPLLIAIGITIALVVYFVLDFLEDVVIGGAPVTSEPIISLIISITTSVTNTVKAFGYSGVFVLMFLESSSLPIPSEVILPYAGFLVSTGQLDFWITVALSTVAGIAGSVIDYYIGLKGVESLMKHRILGKVILSTGQLEVAEKWFLKYGNFIVFISRIIPGFRTTLSFPAGAAKMSMKKFLAFTTAGCFLWNIILIYLGLYLGQNWKQVAGYTRYIIIVAVVAVIIIVAVYLARRRNKALTNQKIEN